MLLQNRIQTIMYLVAAVIAFLFVGCKSNAAQQQITGPELCQTPQFFGKFGDGEHGRNLILGLFIEKFEPLMAASDDSAFDSFKNRLNELNQIECELLDGHTGRDHFSFAMRHALKIVSDKLDGNQHIFKRLTTLSDQHPKSAYIKLLLLQYRLNRAWDERGFRYAGQPSTNNEIAFRSSLTKIKAILEENRYLRKELPQWYEMMFQVMFHTGAKTSELDKLFAEANKHHNFHLPLFYNRSNYLRPEWGGNWTDLDRFIKSSSKLSNGKNDLKVYASLYHYVYSMARADEYVFFRDTQANWEKMKRGLQELVEIHSNSKALKSLSTLLACEARDWDEYSKYRPIIHPRSDWRRWSQRYTVWKCDQIAKLND